jgi:TolB-like protein/DNA-binding winged helix-turn-helix (wHTH) protein/Flp pilus assembly protein TadD
MRPTRRFYVFGAFRIDTKKHVLMRDGKIEALSPKAFDILLVLVQHQGEVLEKSRLMEIIWPDSDVEEANLPQNISILRKVLGESPNERRYIITVPGRGYRFAADVQETDDDIENTDEISPAPVEGDNELPVESQDRHTGKEIGTRPKGWLPASASSTGRRTLGIIGFGVAILTIAVIAIYSRYVGQPTREIRSIAILPFVNESVDPNAEYLSDGITENLINSLSQLSHLKVIARATAFRYKGKETDAQAIGRALSVDAIITGRVTQQGDTLIVQADLLNAADGSQSWGARYVRRSSDVFAVQEQIGKEIAASLRFKLTGEENRALSKRYTENIRAYQNYLLGWSYLHRRTREDLFTAVSYFEKAIIEEPGYALAHAALTEAYVSLTIRCFIAPVEGRRKAENAARNSLSLDANLAEAHAALGETLVFFGPFDFEAGDRELRRAIELSPSLAVAHQALAASLLEQGRLDEGSEVLGKARELDPLSAIIARLEASCYLFKRDYPRSLELLRHSYELGPPFIIWAEIESYIQNGKFDEALAELEKAGRDRKNDPIFIYSAGMIAAAQGKKVEALQRIKDLQTPTEQSFGMPEWVAGIYAAANEKELALLSLERGVETGTIARFYKDAPVWDTIRSDVRFAQVLRSMGIPQ